MAPNGLSNIHVDAYQTDRNTWFGPLGADTGRTSTLQFAECASHTFDRAGRIVTICVGLEGPRLVMFDPVSLHELARLQLPPRQVQSEGSPNPFTNFSGGGYFYLDERDRSVIPTTTRHIWIVAETAAPGFALERDYDLTGAVPFGDAIISALPDWSGRIWFASAGGVVGTVDPGSGAVKSVSLGEPIGNSFAVDETGGVYIVSDKAMYRFDADASGAPSVTWREVYENTGETKSGQTQAGSGTTPTLMGAEHVVITDNADPINVVVYRRARQVSGSRIACKEPVFSRGQSSTDNSPIVTDTAIVVENNHGYEGPRSTQNGQSTVGGVERVDLLPGGGCRKAWHSDARSPSVVPKLSLASGLVYVYTKEPRQDGADAWYLTALDFRTGATVYKRLSGEGLGYNNNYAPITLARDGSAYVGVLGGLVRLADAVPPGSRAPLARRLRLGLRLRYRAGRTRSGRRCARSSVRATLTGRDVRSVRRVDFFVGRRRVARDRRRPFSRVVIRRSRRLRPGIRRVRARALLADRRTATRSRRVRVCPAARAGRRRLGLTG